MRRVKDARETLPRPRPEDWVRSWVVGFEPSEFDQPFYAYWQTTAVVTHEGMTIYHQGQAGGRINGSSIEEIRAKIRDYDSRAKDGWEQARRLEAELKELK